ncbi:DUF2791 family P-loop domain-containing protein [Telmatocola sphagniphila]|uniref:DUF2791 family P-loop domain-containing protein n=1 Tax=Telmatocola sphagniphila TaxID=1123043 RepID=A0A8E6BA77_9BACT|nr:BREX system ATP-binding domain-containing protein [Telmatocola sphagniphila]QVL33996.1 DUF2791 family P-loop domain-containing protein [Telmatocola sphagniphila]
MTAIAPTSAKSTNKRLDAYLSFDSVEVFGSIVHPQNIWKPDPLDVEEIHSDARERFAKLLHEAADSNGGKSLLLLGSAGSGKTHLMRAFRHYAHQRGGYCSYAQMSSKTENYTRYLLGNLIDGLNQPYLTEVSSTPGLTRLAQALLDSLDVVPAEEKKDFREELADARETADRVFRYADFAIQDKRYADCDLDLLRALLFLLPNDARLKSRVIRWLRCEELAPADRELLGGLGPQTAEDSAFRTICGLARVMAAAQQAPLVILADQIEETFDLEFEERESGWLFRKAVDALVNISEGIPNAVVVVACLESYFSAMQQKLTRSKRDRLEQDPKPIFIKENRDADEIEALLAKRLEFLYANLDVSFEGNYVLYPFRSSDLQFLSGKNTRTILNWFRDHQERCKLVERWINPTEGSNATDIEPHQVQKSAPPSCEIQFQKVWNDFLSAHPTPEMEEEEAAELMSLSLEAVSKELPTGVHIGATPSGRFVETEIHFPDNSVNKLLLAICEKKAQGGGLGKQVEEAAKRAGELPVALIRSTDFPDSIKNKVTQQIVQLVAPKGKGKRVVVESGDWRALHAFRTFQLEHQNSPGFAAWQTDCKPLSVLPSTRKILDLDRLQTLFKASTQVVPPTVALPIPEKVQAVDLPKQISVPSIVRNETLTLGQNRGSSNGISIKSQDLKQHMAFLGGSGSGKTTAALTLIEQLLQNGIPVVLIDRKGDLARYADPDAWESTESDTFSTARRNLRQAIDIALFTPGSTAGRHLALPLLSADLKQLPKDEQEQTARMTADAIAGILGKRTAGVDPKLAVLAKAMELLALSSTNPVTISSLRRFVDDRDDSLLYHAEGIDDKHFKNLAFDLGLLDLQYRSLFQGEEELSIDLLLGRGPHSVPGKTRLSIICTHFLGGEQIESFWLSQMLIGFGQWIRKNPAPEGNLQAILMLDEADRYLPAKSSPSTKAPIENLLKRSRSAGLGLFLASQSPGDFDYKCRDQIRAWLVGRVKEQTALKKLKPMFETRPTAMSKIPSQGQGEFHLVQEGEVQSLKTNPSLIQTRQLPEGRILELARK